MANINLLPWREEERSEKQRQFISVLGLVAILGVAVMASIYSYYSDQIEGQNTRNSFLQAQIRKLDTKIKEITSLETERKELIDRMELIQDLQKSRPQIVHLFDEIVQKMPEGINLSEIERKGDDVVFSGAAESAPRIANFMRNLAASQWIAKPNIDQFEGDKDSGSGRKLFRLKTKLISPNATDKGAE